MYIYFKKGSFFTFYAKLKKNRFIDLIRNSKKRKSEEFGPLLMHQCTPKNECDIKRKTTDSTTTKEF